MKHQIKSFGTVLLITCFIAALTIQIEQIGAAEASPLRDFDVQCDEAPSSISQVMSSDDEQLAINAAWQRVLIATEIAMLNPASYSSVPEKAKIETSRFAGFVEGRLQIELPAWWVAHCRTYLPEAYTPMPQGRSNLLPEKSSMRAHRMVSSSAIRRKYQLHDGEGRVWTHKGVKWMDSSRHIAFDGQDIEIRCYAELAKAIENGFEECGAAAISCCQREAGFAYIAIYNPQVSRKYALVRIDLARRCVTWSCLVGVDSRPGGASGLDVVSHHLDLLSTSGRVVIAGADSDGMYLTAIDESTGKQQWLFRSDEALQAVNRE